MDRPSITLKVLKLEREVDRWTEEHDLTVKYDNDDTPAVSNPTSEQLRAFLNKLE